jgi:hypothetical protein
MIRKLFNIGIPLVAALMKAKALAFFIPLLKHISQMAIKALGLEKRRAADAIGMSALP